MLDIVYIFCHSQNEDQELLYSLRSVALHLPYIRKVWIFGDRPEFLTDDLAVAQHIPHEYTARIGRYKLPLRNNLLMTFLASLIPELAFDFMWFADDYVILTHLSQEELTKVRVLEDLSKVKNRGGGLWKQSLWRTYELLNRLGYSGLNFSGHVPLPYTKKRVFDAFCDLQDFVTEDRFFGLLCHTSIFNHALRHESLPLVSIVAEDQYIGFHDTMASFDEIGKKCSGKTFMNFDDKAFNDGMKKYLAERFPQKSKFEK